METFAAPPVTASAEPPPNPAPAADATPVQEAPPPDPIASMTIPEDPVAKAKLYHEMGYGAAAMQVLAALPPEERKKPEIQLLFGLSAEMCGKLKEAAAACEAAEQQPDETLRVDALLCQGRVLLLLKDFKTSMKKFQDAYALSPANPATAAALMNALVILNDAPGLLKFTRLLVEKNPKHHLARLYMGIALGMSQQRELADEIFEKLTNDDSVPAHIEAEAFERRGLAWAKIQPEQAKKILENCRKRLPGYGCPRTELAVSPPDPRHPNRKISNVKRPGRYGETPLPPSP